MRQRDQKLAEMAELAYGLKHGIAAFDDRIDEMGPGVRARAAGRGGKGSHGTPVEAEIVDNRRPTVVTSRLDRLIDRAHAAVVEAEEEYRRIAQPVVGLPAKGEPSCAWCEEAAKAWVKEALKVGDVNAAERSPVALHRCKPYLYAKLKVDNGAREVKVLVCRFCYQFNLPSGHGRRPTNVELWLHAQGRRVLVKPVRQPKMKAAKRVAAKAS